MDADDNLQRASRMASKALWEFIKNRITHSNRRFFMDNIAINEHLIFSHIGKPLVIIVNTQTVHAHRKAHRQIPSSKVVTPLPPNTHTHTHTQAHQIVH